MKQNEVIYKIGYKWYVPYHSDTFICDFDHGDEEAEAEYSIYKNEEKWLEDDICGSGTKRFACEKHATKLIQNQLVDAGLVVRPITPTTQNMILDGYKQQEEEHKHEWVNVWRSDTTCLTVCLCGAHLKLDHHDRPFIEERNN